jgi:hypothetical protein
MRWKSSLAAIFLGLVAAGVATAALAFDFGVANAVSSGNLSVYLVRGADAAAAPLTLEQGLAGGLVKIHEADKLPIQVENLSGRSLFIQVGDMIKGGLQDQVVVSDYVIGPHSGRVPIETLCVDPFRSAARTGDSATAFSATGGLIPSRAATLALLAQPSSDTAVRRLRQSAVWWSIDSVRTALSQRLGHTLETPRHLTWDETQTTDPWALALQQSLRSQWKTSLPLALEDPGLARAERPYLEALLASGQRTGVIGAVFAINGRLEGAEIYQSGRLFRAMWPTLLRAYATRALLAGPDEHAAVPSVADVTAFLDAADAGQLRAGTPKNENRVPQSANPIVGAFLGAGDADQARTGELPDGLRIRESTGAIASESAGANGAWIHRSYVAKLAGAEAGASPEAALVTALDRGEIEGYPVTSLDPREPVVPQTNASGDLAWRVALPASQRLAMQTRAATGQRGAADDEMAAHIQLIVLIWAALVVAFVAGLLLWLAEPLPRIAAGIRRQSTRIAGWTRSAVARFRVDRTAEVPADAVAAPALGRPVLRLADRRRLRPARPVPPRDRAPRTPVGGRTTSDLAA